MPPKRQQQVVVSGGSLKSMFKAVADLAKKTKAISTGAAIAGQLGVPYANQVGTVAKAFGYGKKKPRGRGLNPGGGALRLTGQGRKKTTQTGRR